MNCSIEFNHMGLPHYPRSRALAVCDLNDIGKGETKKEMEGGGRGLWNYFQNNRDILVVLM